MDALNAVVSAINNVLWSYVLIVVLVGCGIWFTLSTRFVQLRMLPEMIRLLTEGIGHKTEGDAISSFQAFCVSTASRVGVGNIAGVAIAIVTGGPGAVFWMWAIAFLGCATGFVESTLAQIYKLPRGNGKFHGGPAYYIKNALRQPGVAKLFAFLISVTFGLIYVSVQANTIALSAQTAFGIAPIYSAAFLCVLTALVIFGGMSRIAKFTEFLVPIMAGIYLLTAFAIILLIMTMPTQVSALGFLQLITKMGLKNSFIPLILPSIAAPTVFFFMKQYLDASLPMEIVEAARIDGAGEFYTFNKIVLPIMKPALAVQAIFSFVASWNNYFIPALVLDSADKKTLPILIAQLRSADFLKFDMGKVYMMVAIAILPVIIVYLLLSKFIVRGVALGGVKG